VPTRQVRDGRPDQGGAISAARVGVKQVEVLVVAVDEGQSQAALEQPLIEEVQVALPGQIPKSPTCTITSAWASAAWSTTARPQPRLPCQSPASSTRDGSARVDAMVLACV